MLTSKTRGFTIVETIIIVIVIGILAAVGAVSWAGIQKMSHNKTRVNELNQWVSAFELYESKHGYFPGMPDNPSLADGTYYYCLGDFASTSNKCGEYTSANANKFRLAVHATDGNAVVSEAIRTELAKVSKVPQNSASPINNSVIGPYVVFSKSTSSPNITITTNFIGLFQGDTCPEETAEESSPAMGSSINDVVACKITRSVTYTP